MLGRFSEALERAHTARDILLEHGDLLRLAALDAMLALLFERFNCPADALDYSRKALDYYETAGPPYYAAAATSNHALLLWRLGRVREALSANALAGDRFAVLGAKPEEVREEGTRGGMLMALGHFAEAVSTLASARRGLLAVGDRYRAALADLLALECHVRMGRYREAITLAGNLDADLAPYDAVADRVSAAVWLALAYAGRGQPLEGIAVLDGAASLVKDHGDIVGLWPIVDLARAQLLSTLGSPDAANALLSSVIPALERAGLTIELATARALSSSILLDLGRDDDALQFASQVLQTAELESLDWLAARALHIRGIVESHRGERSDARQTLDSAISRLARVHRRTAWEDRASLAGTGFRLYEDAVQLALGSGDLRHALYYADMSKARALAEHLEGGVDVRPRARDARSAALIDEMSTLRDRLAVLDAGSPQLGPSSMLVRAAGPTAGAEAYEIQRRIAEIWRELQAANPAYAGEAAALGVGHAQDSGGDAREGAAADLISRLSSQCPADTALLEYFATGPDLQLFVFHDGSLQVITLSGARDTVQRLVGFLRLNVGRSVSLVGRDARALAALAVNARGILQQLHHALLGDALDSLPCIERLIVVPHGVSHHVPFHALHDGDRYLIERFEISYSPSADLLRHFAGRRDYLHSASGAMSAGVVLAYAPEGSLPHVATEGRWVAGASGAQLLSGTAASRSALEGQATRARLLHIAAHAAFNPEEPMLSWIQLADGRLTTLDVFSMELRCSLVTLSACETALGVSGAGDELMGLSRAFLYAGAPSLVLSLWMVEDQTSAVLMREFYAALRAGRSKAAALRQAQVALLRKEVDTGIDASGPFFWAPFQLIGHAGSL